jgi:hypothetical protein
LVVQHRYPLLLTKLDPETSISTPVPTRSFIAVRIIHIPGISIHMPGILIHILPESLFTSPRNRYSHAPEYAYRRAGKPVCRETLDAEWLSIVTGLRG